MANQTPLVTLDVQPFTAYALKIVPLWDGEAERIELGNNLQQIVEAILRDRSVASLVGNEAKPMRLCLIEAEAAIYLPGTGQTFYARERTPVWKIMVPAAGIYRRETIMSCLDRSAGRNLEKYQNLLFHYPQAVEFYTAANNDIRPVDASVFVIEPQARPAGGGRG